MYATKLKICLPPRGKHPQTNANPSPDPNLNDRSHQSLFCYNFRIMSVTLATACAHTQAKMCRLNQAILIEITSWRRQHDVSDHNTKYICEELWQARRDKNATSWKTLFIKHFFRSAIVHRKLRSRVPGEKKKSEVACVLALCKQAQRLLV